MRSKSKITKIFVWTQHFISACAKTTRLTSQGLKLLTIGLMALFPTTIVFAHAVSFSPATDFLVGSLHQASVTIGDLNGDGKPDLAMTNNEGNSVMTWTPGGPFDVNSTADVVDANPGDGFCATAGGVCTLRAAIMEANALAGADFITLPAGTYSLTIPGVNEDFNATGDLDMNSDLTITGAGANLTTIDGGGIDRVLEIRPGNTTNVHVSGLTVTGGKALNTHPGGGNGGGILNGATLTLTNATVSANSAELGGAGIYNDVSGTLTVNSSTVSGNAVTFNANGGGGGIFFVGIGRTLILNGSTVSGNTATGVSFGAGGGILMYHGTLILNNSTVSGNAAKYGGGIVTTNHSIILNLSNSTISGNSGNGGGIRLGEYATINLKNTIVAGNGVDCQVSPTINVVNSLGHNLDSDGTCRLDPAKGDLSNTAAQLAPLALNLPGSTKTHALLAGSPAIDKGGDCLAVDQRGVPRPQGAGCDIGAYEVGAAQSGAACAAPPPNMVAWWPGDGNANDINDGNNGTLVGGVTYAPGKLNQAFNFPTLSSTGSDRVGLNSAPSGNVFTIEAWVFAGQITSPNGYRTIYANNTRGFWLKNGRLNWWSPSIGDRFLGNTAVTLGAWHHIALTYSQGTFTGYLNGVNVGSSSSPGEFLPTGNGLGIGGHSGFVSEDFDGLIDELAIYNRALDPAEIQAIFNAGSAGKCKTVVSLNKPPVANAGPDQTVEATSPSGASVTLNGSGSSDPDSNPLAYNWTGPFGTVSGVSPTVTLPLGTHTVTLKVSDGQATVTDTVIVNVRDTTPPDTSINSAVDGNGAAVASGRSTLSGSITLTFGGTDAVGVAGFQCSRDGSGFAPCTSPAGQSALTIGNHSFQVRAVDAAGNVDASPTSFNWAVITPAQAIQNLITTINNMGLAGAAATSLTAPLSNINTNNKAAACAKLSAFINQVHPKVQNGQLTPAQASQLLQEANAIKASLGC